MNVRRAISAIRVRRATLVPRKTLALRLGFRCYISFSDKNNQLIDWGQNRFSVVSPLKNWEKFAESLANPAY